MLDTSDVTITSAPALLLRLPVSGLHVELTASSLGSPVAIVTSGDGQRLASVPMGFGAAGARLLGWRGVAAGGAAPPEPWAVALGTTEDGGPPGEVMMLARAHRSSPLMRRHRPVVEEVAGLWIAEAEGVFEAVYVGFADHRLGHRLQPVTPATSLSARRERLHRAQSGYVRIAASG